MNTKAKKTENKIPDATGFVTTAKFNRLTKISFDAKMKETVKILASKSEVDNALDIADKNGEKITKL